MSTADDVDHTSPLDALWKAFVDPPDHARPRAWWHWMDGNVDPEGVQRDLTWLHAVGVRGVQLFDGGMGMPLVVPEAVRPGTAVWRESVDRAVRVTGGLGMELAVATSSGWSAAGGPWVRPADAMKKVVWAETAVAGGGPVLTDLPPLPAVAGPYQDCPRWGAADSPTFATDWVVLAMPDDPAHRILQPDEVRASGDVEDRSRLTDGSFASAVSLPRDPDGWSTAWIEQAFDEPVTVRSVVVGLPGPRGFGAAPAPSAVLQACDDGEDYRDVAVLEPTTVPARTASFGPVTARRFRLVLSAGSAADALPPTAPGVRLPPVLRRAEEFLVSEFALRTAGRVHHAQAKAGFGAIPDYFAIDTDPAADFGAVDPATVIDLTPHVADGTLRWNAPPGHWRILRLGASLTGQTNGPAPADSTGLEVDKLDGRRVADYLAAHLERFEGSSKGSRSRFSALLSDSIESGAQNFTDRIREHFRARRGYDPLSMLPALTGILVGDADRSDRFLFDYRRTIAELFADEYYGTLHAEASRRGMTYYAEALEDGRPQLGDDLAMRAHTDVPMGAMWTFAPEAGPRPTYVADLKGAASVAHVHAKPWTGSEAFTSFDDPWSWTPRTLKHIADLQLSLGVTRFCLHTSPHQPLAAPPPGIALAPFLGQAFTIHETWSGMAAPWIDYLARCSAVLSAGRPAVEIAVFVGEEAPVTGLFAEELDHAVPEGLDFDYIGPDALATVLRVEHGALVSDGAQYRVLYLGGSSRRMTVAALRSVERLVDAGATVVGRPPASSPALSDDPAAFAAVRDRIWAPGRRAGRVIADDLPTALDRLGVSPAVEVQGAPVRRIARVVEGRRVTFLANPRDESVSLRVRSSTGGAMAGWDPVTVRRLRLASSPSAASGREYTVELAPFGSVFVIEEPRTPDEPAAESPGERVAESPGERVAESPGERVALAGEWRVQLAGAAPSATSPSPRLWTGGDAASRGFSGVGVYSHDFSLTATQAGATQLHIEFTAVRDIARVIVNGHDCGVVWTAPFRAEVTAAVRSGRNSLEVHVATPWRNRLIAEADAPTGDVFAPMTTVFDPTATPLPAGLEGAVTLLVAHRAAG